MQGVGKGGVTAAANAMTYDPRTNVGTIQLRLLRLLPEYNEAHGKTTLVVITSAKRTLFGEKKTPTLHSTNPQPVRGQQVKSAMFSKTASISRNAV